MVRRVVEIKQQKAKIEDLDIYREFIERLTTEIITGTAREKTLGGGPCEEACREHEGVDVCGETFVICNDGEIYLIDP